MRFKDIKSDIGETTWKWRCKEVPKADDASTSSDDSDSTHKEENAKAKKPSKTPGFGSEAAIKTMYESKHSSFDNYDWVDYPPKQISKSAARAQDRVAVKVFKVKDREKTSISGRLPLRYHMLHVQSPLLVAALEPIVKKEDVNLDINETAVFTHPFRPLWFCSKEIADLHARTKDNEPLKSHLTILVNIMNDMFSELHVRRKHQTSSGLIDFKTAWTLFPRDTTLYSYGLNSEHLSRVATTEYVERRNGTYLAITTKILAFNGEEFVWTSNTASIKAFKGNKPVAELAHYPLKFHSDAEAIEARCVARGKKALDFQGLAYCCYDGLAVHTSGDESSRHNVKSRILIDPVGYNRYHLSQGKRENKDPETERNRANRQRGRRPGSQTQQGDNEDTPELKSTYRLSEEEQEANKKDMLSREQELAFVTEHIGGYALNNKIWVQFYIEDIQPMIWNDQAYSHLVYDDQQKDLVLSFVENHNKSLPSTQGSGSMEDVIRGKGQGLILLLSGPPGTGKTLMAEAVADRTQRPLFYLQAEDLGINASSLGANIKRVFEMATDWNAVILLDEADVFMAERNPNDIHRNELVSIFLRELEYFRGIIFLTTNLYHTIDTAFRSRVNLHLLFQALSRPSREAVWRKFIERMVPVPEPDAVPGAEGDSGTIRPAERPLDDEDIRELSMWQLNGREIKNAVKMVRSWCQQKNYLVTLERMESGIKVTNPNASKEGDVSDDLYS